MIKTENIRLIALDLDDTTLRHDSRLDSETKAAICRALDAGIEVVIASGRAFNSLPGEVCAIKGIRYAITSNGAAVSSNPDGRTIISLVLHPETVADVLESYCGEMLEAFIGGQAYCDKAYIADPVRWGCAPEYVEYVQTTRLPVEDMHEFIKNNADRLDGIDVICTSPEHKTRLWEKAKKLRRAYVTSSAPRLIEIADENAGKGAALRRLCEMLNIAPEHTAAFGNGDNDADMLAFAGLGVAVENASEHCRSCADHICPSNDELGVAKTIHMILGERI